MKKTAALILALVLALSLCGTAFADNAEPGLLRTAVLYDISTMDVAETTDDYLVPMNVFDRLFETRPNGSSSEVVKSLVTDWSVSEDGLTYDFTTASDVQFSFERLLKAAKENTDIPLEVAGGEAVLSGEADSLEGFKVTDDTHFSVTLSQPNAGFVAELSAPAMWLRQGAGGNHRLRPVQSDGVGQQRSLYTAV